MKKIKFPKKLEKWSLIELVKSLNAIIDSINEGNCYDKVVEFFAITAYLQDNSSEIKELIPPVKGFKFLGIKGARLRRSENRNTGGTMFLSQINGAGRNVYFRHYNHTNYGENVTKKNVFFEADCGWVTIKFCESERAQDEDLQKHIREQIVRFVKSFSFDVTWLD